MKKFNCNKCGKFLGEMEKGRILKNVTMYCSECQSLISLIETEYSIGNKSNKTDFTNNIFEDLFKGFKK